MRTGAPEEAPAKTWRDNWIVKNWLTALPFVGGFFKTANLKEAANHLGHYTFMLAGGTTLMLLEVLPTSMDESPVVKHTKMTTNMAIGMAVGEVAYNTLFSVTKSAIDCCRKRCVESTERAPYQALP